MAKLTPSPSVIEAIKAAAIAKAKAAGKGKLSPPTWKWRKLRPSLNPPWSGLPS